MKLLISIEELDKLKSRDLVPMECDSCGKKFLRKKHQLQAKIKIGVTYFRCNPKCREVRGKFVKCHNCEKEIYKFPKELKQSTNHYCSNKCANIKTNEKRWENHISITKSFKCPTCGNERGYRSKHCKNCHINQQDKINKNKTVGELKEKYKTNKHLIHWYSSEIRSFNRRWNKDLLNLPCQKCGYSVHTELCHIKPISEFNNNSKLEDVNNKNNNLILCPNHHYEFDNGILKIEDIPKRNGETGGI